MPYAGGVVPYRKKCEEVAAKGYEGFHLRASQGHVTANLG
jgi:cyclohexanone monooxygenase